MNLWILAALVTPILLISVSALWCVRRINKQIGKFTIQHEETGRLQDI